MKVEMQAFISFKDTTATYVNVEVEEDSMDKDLVREMKVEGDRKHDLTIGSEDITKKSKNRPKSKEGKRKSQGLKNPFLIFAREHRSNIKTFHKGHSSRILADMWYELDSSEKKKYFEKAKRPYSEVVPSDILTCDGKSRNKTKKKKEPKQYASENGVPSSKNDTAGILEKKENLDSAGVEAQPSAQSCPLGALQSVYRFPRSPASIIPYSSNMGGFYRPSFYPPDPLWMYHQAMFPPPPYYPFASHCHCCPLSFRGYGPSSHFQSVIYERTNALPSTVSPHNGHDDGVSDDEENRLVIVDDSDEQQ